MYCQVWKMRTGSRVLTIPCPKGSRILQPSARLSTLSLSSSYSPLEVYLFNGDSGQLSVLNRHVGWIICSFVVLLNCYCQVLYRNTCFVIVFTILLIEKKKRVGGSWLNKRRRTETETEEPATGRWKPEADMNEGGEGWKKEIRREILA